MRETRSGLAGARQPVCFPLVPGAGMCRGAGCITVGQVSACVVGANAGPGKWFSGMSAGLCRRLVRMRVWSRRQSAVVPLLS